MTQEKPKSKGPALAIALGAVALVCVLCCGGAAAIGFSSWQDFLIRSKSSEASSNLRYAFQGAASYYASEVYPSGGLIGTGAAQSSCTVSAARTSNAPGATKSVLDWDSEHESFRAINFSIADPVYYRYAIEGPPGRCGNAPSTPLYTFSAAGDLDGDGEQSRFQVVASSTPDNELMRGEITSDNELE